MGHHMNFTPTKLSGVFLIENIIRGDERGDFIKVFNHDTFLKAGFDLKLQESYYSTSKKDVIRGMHFQLPPMEHTKLVYVTQGSMTDVIVDIRKDSPTFGQYITLELNDQNRHAVIIPPGFAHGFHSHVDGTSVTYLQTTMYSPDHDAGIKFDSFGYDWKVAKPIMSQRDQIFPTLVEFATPFTYQA